MVADFFGTERRGCIPSFLKGAKITLINVGYYVRTGLAFITELKVWWKLNLHLILITNYLIYSAPYHSCLLGDRYRDTKSTEMLVILLCTAERLPKGTYPSLEGQTPAWSP